VVRLEDREHFPQKTFRRPIGQGNLATAFGHPLQLGSGEMGTGREHHAEHAHDEIELRFGVGQRLGVALPEIDAQAGLGGAGVGLLDEIVRDIDAADHAAPAGRDEGEISRAASHIEHQRAGFEKEPRHEFFGRDFNGAGDLTEVAGFPSGFLFGFEGFQVGDDGIESAVHGARLRHSGRTRFAARVNPLAGKLSRPPERLGGNPRARLGIVP